MDQGCRESRVQFRVEVLVRNKKRIDFKDPTPHRCETKSLVHLPTELNDKRGGNNFRKAADLWRKRLRRTAGSLLPSAWRRIMVIEAEPGLLRTGLECCSPDGQRKNARLFL